MAGPAARARRLGPVGHGLDAGRDRRCRPDLRGLVWDAGLPLVRTHIVAVPNAAAASGLAFLVSLSGWLMRLRALALGWDVPPDPHIVQNRLGLTLTAGLIVEELPFPLPMMLAATAQADARRRLAVARSLGPGRVAGWLKTAFPSVDLQVRLLVLVVLFYGMTNIDVAVILGPNIPATLSVQVTRWMLDRDLARRTTEVAGAMAPFAAVLAGLAAWLGGERLATRLGRGRVWTGGGLP